MTEETPVKLDDLKVGSAVQGTVKSVELYGAFVDIGIGRDALLHISQLGKSNVRNVEDVVKVGDEVTVYILKVDKDAGRVTLSLVKPPDVPWQQLQAGQTYTGTVTRIEKFGVFVDIGAERPGMAHVSELADGFVKSPHDVVSIGDEVEVRVIKVNRRKRQIDLSMKSEQPTTQEVFEDESEEEAPTAMALAFRRAMEEQEDDDEDDRAQNKKSRGNKDEQEDILSRTLRHHTSS